MCRNLASVTPLLSVIAHRGASGYRPEHTRSAYLLGLTLGADGIEPDIVPTRDGVLVLRHENEISTTTDVASRPEFAERRTTKIVDGVQLTGWFTEDFTWAELSTLRAIERLPKVRPANATFDGMFPVLRLTDLLEIVDAADRPVTLVAELKHANYFDSIGLRLGELFAAEIAGWATGDNLLVESFEQGVLGDIHSRGVPGQRVYLIEDHGSAADLVASQGEAAPSYTDQLTDDGLAALAASVDGVSLNASLILERDGAGTTDVVQRAHAAGLSVFTWTLRPENRFLPKNLRRGDDPSHWGNWLEAYRLLLNSGVDGVFADHPDLAIIARDSLA